MIKYKLILGCLIVIGMVAMGLYIVSSDTIFKKSQPSNAYTSDNDQTTSTTGETKVLQDFQATLTAQPTNITVSADTKDISKIEKSKIKISYSNSTGSNLTGVQITMKASGNTKFGLSGSETAKLNKSAGEGSKFLVFDLQDIKSGEAKDAYIFLFGREPGSYIIGGELKTTQGKTVTTNEVTVSAK